jgi:hypothetical protein
VWHVPHFPVPKKYRSPAAASPETVTLAMGGLSDRKYAVTPSSSAPDNELKGGMPFGVPFRMMFAISDSDIARSLWLSASAVARAPTAS